MNILAKTGRKSIQEIEECVDKCSGSCCNGNANERNTSLLMGLNVAN